MADWSDDPQFKEFAKQVLRDTVPKIAESTFVISIAPDGGAADVKMAVEIGFAILIDKPLIVLAPKGRTVASRLLRIADHVIEGDITTEAGREAVMQKLQAVMKQ